MLLFFNNFILRSMCIVTCLAIQSVARLQNSGNDHVTVFCVVRTVTIAMQRLGKQPSKIERLFSMRYVPRL
jgi:hypothetical protein